MPRSTSAFPGFPPVALEFFAGLAANNNKEWFEKNKPVFENQVKAPMESLVAALGQEMVRYAPDYITEPKKAIFRIYRDVRFSKNKDPYKTNIGATMRRQNLGKGDGAIFYVHLDANEMFIAGGVYMPMPDVLKTLRLYIADHYEEMQKLLAAKPLKKYWGEMQGESLARAPKGFLPGHPAEELLKRKMFVFSHHMPATAALKPGVVKEISTRFEALTPVVEFLNRPLVAGMKRDRRTFLE